MNTWKHLTARDLMKSPVVALDVETSLAEAARTLSENQISGALVTDHRGAAVGVVSLFDIVTALAGWERPEGEPGGFYRYAYPRYEGGDNGWVESWEEVEESPMRKTTVGEIMAPEIITVPPDATAPEVARSLWNRRIHRVFVAERGGPIGVISALDVLGALAALPEAKAKLGATK